MIYYFKSNNTCLLASVLEFIWYVVWRINSLSFSYSHSTEVAHSCLCQRCERRWKQPAVTMCSCISNFLNREVGMNRKGEVLRKRSERWRERKRKADAVSPLPTNVLCNWADFRSVCFSAFLVCMFESENISSQPCLFRGHQFCLPSLFHIAPRESLPCCLFPDTDDCILLLSWIFRNGTCEMQNVHIAALHRFWFFCTITLQRTHPGYLHITLHRCVYWPTLILK